MAHLFFSGGGGCGGVAGGSVLVFPPPLHVAEAVLTLVVALRIGLVPAARLLVDTTTYDWK